jgi:hypothetical protein
MSGFTNKILKRFIGPILRMRFVQFSAKTSVKQFPSGLDNDRSPHEYINQRLQIQFEAPDYERYAAEKMLSLQ